MSPREELLQLQLAIRDRQILDLHSIIGSQASDLFKLRILLREIEGWTIVKETAFERSADSPTELGYIVPERLVVYTHEDRAFEAASKLDPGWAVIKLSTLFKL